MTNIQQDMDTFMQMIVHVHMCALLIYQMYEKLDTITNLNKGTEMDYEPEVKRRMNERRMAETKR